MPKKKPINKTLAILGYLTRYGSITRQAAASLFEVWNLPFVISSLNKAGHGIVSTGKGKNLKYTIYKVAEKYGKKADLSPQVNLNPAING